jgi:DNA-binding transcriptional regulator YdaS (Cro superfamily)
MAKKVLNPALARAVAIVGSQARLANLIEKKQGHVWDWLYKTGRPLPECCIPIETATNGIVTRYELRPDVFGESQEKAP